MILRVKIGQTGTEKRAKQNAFALFECVHFINIAPIAVLRADYGFRIALQKTALQNGFASFEIVKFIKIAPGSLY